MMRPTGIILTHAFIGWVICAAIMGIGMQVFTLHTTLVIHAIGGPLAFAIISFVYFKRFGYTTPLQTAMIFIGVIAFMDFFLVTLVIKKSLAMFQSVLGTWLPFVLIFLATFFTGLMTKKNSERNYPPARPEDSK